MIHLEGKWLISDTNRQANKGAHISLTPSLTYHHFGFPYTPCPLHTHTYTQCVKMNVVFKNKNRNILLLVLA